MMPDVEMRKALKEISPMREEVVALRKEMAALKELYARVALSNEALRKENCLLRRELLNAVVEACNDYFTAGNFDRIVRTGLIDLQEYEERVTVRTTEAVLTFYSNLIDLQESK